MDPRFKTSLACQIAHLDRQALAQAISDGFFECAPATSPGKVRIFNVSDVLALCIFARLLKLSFSVKEAARIACRMRYTLPAEGLPDDFVRRPLAAILFPATDGEPIIQRRPREIPETVPDVRIAGALVFDLSYFHAHILDCAEAHIRERLVLGDDV